MRIIIAYDRFRQESSGQPDETQNEVVRAIIRVFRDNVWPLDVGNVFFSLNTTIEIDLPGLQTRELEVRANAIVEELTPIAHIRIYYGEEFGNGNPNLDQTSLREKMRAFIAMRL